MFGNVFNFRDLSTADSSRVRPGRLFRSDSLSRLDDADWARFATLGVRTVVDLRTPGEVGVHGRVRQSPGMAYHNFSVLHGLWSDHPYSPVVGVVRYLADRYLEIAEDGAGELRGVLTVLSAPAVAPAVVHCAGGRDRTGVVSALVLGLMGVSDTDIAADYARTAETSHLVTAWLATTYGKEYGYAPQYTETPAEAMSLFLMEMRAKYGGIAEYVAAIGVPAEAVESLRAHLAVDATL